jgi:hypothetical protein
LKEENNMFEFYTMMVQKFGKDIESVPSLYREQVRINVYGAPEEPIEEVVEETAETPTETE